MKLILPLLVLILAIVLFALLVVLLIRHVRGEAGKKQGGQDRPVYIETQTAKTVHISREEVKAALEKKESDESGRRG